MAKFFFFWMLPVHTRRAQSARLKDTAELWVFDVELALFYPAGTQNKEVGHAFWDKGANPALHHVIKQWQLSLLLRWSHCEKFLVTLVVKNFPTSVIFSVSFPQEAVFHIPVTQTTRIQSYPQYPIYFQTLLYFPSFCAKVFKVAFRFFFRLIFNQFFCVDSCQCKN